MANIRANDSDIVFVRFIDYYFKYGYVCGGVGGWMCTYECRCRQMAEPSDPLKLEL